jgi:glycosyltransferase involved in cell wall biosynthesis
MLDQPLLPHVGICALVADNWTDVWRRRHQALTRLTRYFYVAWVNPASDWRGIIRRSRGQTPRDSDVIPPPRGLTVCDPVWLPRLYRPQWLRQHSFDARVKYARRMLIRRGCQKIILYICRPEFASALNSIPFDLSCYHIDDEYSFSEVERPLDSIESSLIANVNQVFIHSPKLMERKGNINPNTAYMPNGVDFQAYATTVPKPLDLSSVPRPIVGYTGFLKKQLQWPLILQLVKRHREWSFVFVGPTGPHPELRPAIQEISSFRNAYFLGAKPARALASYPQHFDVCIMPYRVDAYTNNIYPLKLHEFLASGRPVVSSPIRSLQGLSGVVTLAESLDDWSRALADSLQPAAGSREAVAVRQKIAREHDWETLTDALAQTFCERLGPAYTDQFAKLGY